MIFHAQKFFFVNIRLKDLGHLKIFLGIKLSRSKKKEYLYVKSIMFLSLFKDCGMYGRGPSTIPIYLNLKLIT